MILILALLSILIPAQTLSGAAAASFCHCDLIPSFCDINCCCDSDCSAVHYLICRLYPPNAII